MNKPVPIIFIHGFPLDGSMWEKQVNYFKDKYSVFAIDLPGFGKNSIETPDSIEGFADYIHQFMKQHNLDKAILCGFSMGGYITFAFYEMFKDLVKGLIFVDTKAKDDSSQAKEGRDSSISETLNKGVEFFMEGMPPTLLSKRSLDEGKVVVKLREIISHQKEETIIKALTAMKDRKDRSYILKKIDVPTLFICGEEDILSTKEEMEEMAKAVKKSRFEVVKDCGHLTPMENPEQFNQVLKSFLEEEIK
jgi:pimeloyl-ACP methyl ester carboxylesterase